MKLPEHGARRGPRSPWRWWPSGLAGRTAGRRRCPSSPGTAAWMDQCLSLRERCQSGLRQGPALQPASQDEAVLKRRGAETVVTNRGRSPGSGSSGQSLWPWHEILGEKGAPWPASCLLRVPPLHRTPPHFCLPTVLLLRPYPSVTVHAVPSHLVFHDSEPEDKDLQQGSDS